MTMRSTKLGLAISFGLVIGLGSTIAQACDYRVTTRPGDLWGGSAAPVIRDHRNPSVSPSGGVTVVTTPLNPVVRDHRNGPVVRDHRR